MKKQRGYMLIVVMMLALVMAGSLSVFMARTRDNAHVSADVVASRRVFHAADGVSRAALELANQYLRQNSLATPAQLQAHLTSEAATVTPPGYTLEPITPSGPPIEVIELGAAQLAPLPNGPYRNMNARQQNVGIRVRLRENRSGVASEVSNQVILGTVSMFQFFAFIDGYAYVFSGTGVKYAGRIHANGNICFGSVYAEQITTADGFYLAGSSGCRGEHNNNQVRASRSFIASGPLPNGANDILSGLSASATALFRSVVSGGTHYDRDDNSGSDIAESTWLSRSRGRFNGQLQDRSHGVTPLKVPITGTPLTQSGRNASHTRVSNLGNSRFLVDPIVPSHVRTGEPADVREQKFAYKADIRILNGVWYLKNASDPTRLGTPIWSDHPGTFDATDDMDHWGNAPTGVGQADLYPGNVPRYYSYYRTDGDAANIGFSGTAVNALPTSDSQVVNNTWDRPVVSYGSLWRGRIGGGRPYWVPGYLPLNGSTRSISRAATHAERLQATRSGYRDGWAEVGMVGDIYDPDRPGSRARYLASVGRPSSLANWQSNYVGFANMLPMNFDVGAFSRALQNTGTGELGTHIDMSTFNGIVWIGSTWPGQSNGYAATDAATGPPALWPDQGAQGDCDTTSTVNGTNLTHLQSRCRQPFHNTGYDGSSAVTAVVRANNAPLFSAGANNTRYQMALPYALCSDSAVSGAARNYITPGGSEASIGAQSLNNSANTTSMNRVFEVPDCARYRASHADNERRVRAFANAVRVINGHSLEDFPLGLTIATNLPMVVLGDYNVTSTPANQPGVTYPRCDTGASPCYTPALLAGDTITLQSSDWEDDEAPWNRPIGVNRGARRAGDTRYHFAALTGWLESDAGFRDELPYVLRPTEDWRDVRRNVRGSLVIGYNSAFGVRFRWDGANSTDNDRYKINTYDYNLDVPSNQPPGAPELRVTAIRRFSQRR